MSSRDYLWRVRCLIETGQYEVEPLDKMCSCDQCGARYDIEKHQWGMRYDAVACKKCKRALWYGCGSERDIREALTKQLLCGQSNKCCCCASALVEQDFSASTAQRTTYHTVWTEDIVVCRRCFGRYRTTFIQRAWKKGVLAAQQGVTEYTLKTERTYTVAELEDIADLRLLLQLEKDEHRAASYRAALLKYGVSPEE